MNVYVFMNFIVGAILLLISKLLVRVSEKSGKSLSLHKVFGIVDVAWGVVILIIALIEFMVPGGDMHGLFGTVILLIFEPGVIIFLIIDIVLYKKDSNRDIMN